MAKAGNKDIGQAWKDGRAMSAPNLTTNGREVFSYNLIIGRTTELGRKVVLDYRAPENFVSRTTSGHVARIARYADEVQAPTQKARVAR